MSIIKIFVCTSCQSPAITDKDCICVWESKYPTIELEFEQCDCCGRTSDFPANTKFNDEQLGFTEEEEEEEN